MQKIKLNLLRLSFVAATFLPIFTLACSGSKVDKGKDENDEKEKAYKFTEKVVDEKWSDIDVNVNSLEDWLKVKTIYEQAIIKLNKENQNLLISDYKNYHQYYKNLFYIVWYLRVIGKSNQNISWLKFHAQYNDILDNDEKEPNFIYTLYVQQRLPESLYNYKHNYFFKNFVKYDRGDLRTTYVHIPDNYLNFDTKKIDASDIMDYYRTFMLWEDRNNIWKVLQYFNDKKDNVKYKMQIEDNNKAFEKRWKARIWNPKEAITYDHAYQKWLANVIRGGTRIEDYEFLQLSWEDWINNF